MDKRRGVNNWAKRTAFGLLLLLLSLVTTRPALAQTPPDTLPRGRFRQATVRVGEIVEYELTSRHSPRQEIIFPDSAADFFAFRVRGPALFSDPHPPGPQP